MSKGVGFIGQAPCYTPFSQQMSSAVGSIGSMIKEKNSQEYHFNPNYRPDYPPIKTYDSLSALKAPLPVTENMLRDRYPGIDFPKNLPFEAFNPSSSLNMGTPVTAFSLRDRYPTSNSFYDSSPIVNSPYVSTLPSWCNS